MKAILYSLAPAALVAYPVSAQGRVDPLAEPMLLVHNQERARVGVPPLVWDPELARAAASYGPALAAAGSLVHSPRASRPGQRESLSWGHRGMRTPAQLAEVWLAERRHFLPGTFPAVSRTGSWQDVAHYTQIVWRTTTRLGCAHHSSAQWDFLICRYSPPGNVDGRRVF